MPTQALPDSPRFERFRRLASHSWRNLLDPGNLLSDHSRPGSLDELTFEPGRLLIDMCASITTTSMTRQKFAAGEPFEHPWLLDAQGVPTRDPAVLENAQPPGSIQLMGGQEYGHKGFGLALMIEALSQGLSGHGRRDAPKRWGGNVFLQVLDPEFFAGREAFADQMNYLAEKSRGNRPIRADRTVRLPGDQAAQSIAAARKRGIASARSPGQRSRSAGELRVACRASTSVGPGTSLIPVKRSMLIAKRSNASPV